ncbi:MAG TPA: thioredoxin domain-containing protein [Thermoanaerobaculia bacterium]|nr:thioredoxin domain-containing protein [Thermoanaerobaculia bacterium]
MKRYILTFFCTLFVCASALAFEVDPKLDRAVRAALPVCADSTIAYSELPASLPRFTGALVRVESKRPACAGQLSALLSPTGGFYLGIPWPIANEPGTIEEKLKSFTWRNMQMNITAEVDRKNPTADGLLPVTLYQTTETGKLPLYGSVDPNGKFFFFGQFRRLSGDLRAQRAKAFDAFLANSPSRGSAGAPVTIIEFSDFECPSCKRASGYVDPILAKHGDKVRYVRYDLPLSGHPWAFAASMAGRAIHRQKPELFWEFKKQVYENQESLNAFTFGEWARGFAEDRELDMKRYDADIVSEEIRNELLKGAGTAFSNDVRATPTYLVNGVPVDAGDQGKALAEYVDALVTPPARPDPEKPSASAQ